MTHAESEQSKQPKTQISDNVLRPRSLDEFVGQSKIKKALKIFIQAARQRKEPIEHTLFYGPPGLGKTTLAYILSQEMNVNIRITSGPAIERAGDLASILTNLQHGDILFIDEIHRLNKTIEETLYPAMEDYCLDIIIGKGPSARTLRLDLPKFTIIGATTRIGLISSPLRDRFGVIHKLNFYNRHELTEILTRSAELLNIHLSAVAADQIARCSRGTPRIANKLLKRIRDVAQINKTSTISHEIIYQSLKILEIDQLGLNQTDRQFIQILAEKYQGGPVGLNTISAALSEDEQTIEDFIEPYLLQIGMIKRTSRGRQITPAAYKHINITPPSTFSKQENLDI
jgi:Holliday junction DNA helicase RuvB